MKTPKFQINAANIRKAIKQKTGQSENPVEEKAILNRLSNGKDTFSAAFGLLFKFKGNDTFMAHHAVERVEWRPAYTVIIASSKEVT